MLENALLVPAIRQTNIGFFCVRYPFSSTCPWVQDLYVCSLLKPWSVLISTPPETVKGHADTRDLIHHWGPIVVRGPSCSQGNTIPNWSHRDIQVQYTMNGSWVRGSTATCLCGAVHCPCCSKGHKNFWPLVHYLLPC